MSQTITALEAHLDAHVSYVRGAAKNPGSWPDVQRHYGLPVEPAPFGAVSAAQVHAVMQAIVLGAARQLETTSAPPTELERLWQRLGRLAADEANAQAATVAPKSNLGLGGIFANATAHVGKEWWAGMKYDHVLMAICRTCGAAQEKPRDFKCSYCGGALFGKPGGESR